MKKINFHIPSEMQLPIESIEITQPSHPSRNRMQKEIKIFKCADGDIILRGNGEASNFKFLIALEEEVAKELANGIFQVIHNRVHGNF